MADVVGIVLGAGASRRLGRPKQTLPFGDTSLLGWVVREVEASSRELALIHISEPTRQAEISYAVVCVK